MKLNGIDMRHQESIWEQDRGSNKAKIAKILELGITTHYDNNPDVISELGSIGRKI